MNTAAIEAFLAIIRQGSLTEAANSLFISQSTLSHRLSELEQDVGMVLIDRSRGVRSLSLTEYGKEFLIIAKRWENLIHDTQQIRTRQKKFMLSLGAVDTIHTYMLSPLYQVLREERQDLSLCLKTYNSTELYLQVDRGEIDIAFALLDLPMKNVIVQKFHTDARVVLRREISPISCGGLIARADLDARLEVFFEGDPLFHTWYQRWRGDEEYPPIQVDTPQLLLPFLNKVGMWAIVPECMARRLAVTGTFSYYNLKDLPPQRICYKIRGRYPRSKALEGLRILEHYLDSLF